MSQFSPIQVPQSRQVVKVSFTPEEQTLSPEVDLSTSSSPTLLPQNSLNIYSPDKDTLKQHIFLSSLSLDSIGEDDGEEKKPEEVEETRPNFSSSTDGISTSTTSHEANERISPYENISSSTKYIRPTLSKQIHDIDLLVKQFYSTTQARFQWEESSALEANSYSEEGKVSASLNQSSKSLISVLYLISSAWMNLFVSTTVGQSDQIVPTIDNSCLLDPSEMKSTPLAFDLVKGYKLRESLKEERDFYLLPKEAWDALSSWYGFDVTLPRHVVIRATSTSSLSPFTLTESLCLYVPSKLLNSLFTNSTCRIDLYEEKIVTESDSQIFHEILYSRLTSLFSSNSSSSSYLPSPSSSPRKESKAKVVSSFKLSSFIYNDVGTVGSDKPMRCFICTTKASFRCSKCMAVHYCSKECQRIHWKYHKVWCSSALTNRSLSPSQFAIVVPLGRRGKVGLHNLGNSCYMNSSLQCISHITPLTKYLLSERYQQDLNQENRDGTGGMLANEMFSILKDLWLDNKSVISPIGIKRVLGRTNSDYAGVQQHDAHEVTMLILDKLHEDLNKVHKKPYTVNPEGDGTNDEKIFQEAWEKHLLRENSVVQQMIGGAVRNEISCQYCNKTVVQFDYQHAIQLAIPKKTTKTIYVAYIPYVDAKLSSSSSHSLSASTTWSPAAILRSYDVDKLTTVKQLKSLLLSGSESLNETSTMTELEREATPTSFVMDDLMMFEVDKQSLSISRFLHPNTMITSINSNNFISVYHIPNRIANEKSQSRIYMILSMRIISSSQLDVQGRRRYQSESIGLPMMLSVQSSWSCHRVRILIFQQIERFINPSSIIGKYYRQLCDTQGVIKAQLIISKYLPLRVVNDHGIGVTVRFDAFSNDSNLEINEEISQLLTNFEDNHVLQALGSAVPADKYLKLADFMQLPKNEDIVFLSVDWSHNWLESLIEDKVDIVELLSSATQSLQVNPLNQKSILMTNDKTVGRISQLSLASAMGQSSKINLESCLQDYTKQEILENGNEWYCSSCKTHRRATKRVSFGKLELLRS